MHEKKKPTVPILTSGTIITYQTHNCCPILGGNKETNRNLSSASTCIWRNRCTKDNTLVGTLMVTFDTKSQRNATSMDWFENRTSPTQNQKRIGQLEAKNPAKNIMFGPIPSLILAWIDRLKNPLWLRNHKSWTSAETQWWPETLAASFPKKHKNGVWTKRTCLNWNVKLFVNTPPDSRHKSVFQNC